MAVRCSFQPQIPNEFFHTPLMFMLQFFRADSAEMRKLAALWEARGWAQKWNCRFGGDGDFFGVPTSDAPVYCGAGGMHTLPRSILRSCDKDIVRVQVGARVTSLKDSACTSAANARWALFGVSGDAAYHDTPEAQARASENALLGFFDIVSILYYLCHSISSFSTEHQFQTVTPCTCAAHRHIVVLRLLAPRQRRCAGMLRSMRARPCACAAFLRHGRF